MSRYRISQQAARDLNQIRDYLDEVNPAIVDKLFDAIEKTVKLVAEQPTLGPELPQFGDGLRHVIPRRPANRYIIFYYVKDFGIEIANVVHQSRNWQRIFDSEQP